MSEYYLRSDKKWRPSNESTASVINYYYESHGRPSIRRKDMEFRVTPYLNHDKFSVSIHVKIFDSSNILVMDGRIEWFLYNFNIVPKGDSNENRSV